MDVDQWAKHTREGTPPFNLDGVDGQARLVDCYDGDTCKVLLSIPWAGGAVRLVTLRLEGIDAPEMNAKDPGQQASAVRARDRLLNTLCPDGFPVEQTYTKKDILAILRDRVVLARVQCMKQDKYGRCLARVYTDDNGSGTCVNDVLLAQKDGIVVYS